MQRKPGRPRAGARALTHEQIVATALALVDAHGVEALSMRRLATALAVDPMAIYHYFPNKRALLAALVTHVFGQLRLPRVDSATWQDGVHAFAGAYHELARAHPNLVLYLASDPQAAARAALASCEVLYAALAAAGLSPAWIVRAADLVVDYLNGFVLAERSSRLGAPAERRELFDLLAEQRADQAPTMQRVFNSVDPAAARADLADGLAIILAGITAIAGQPPAQQ